VTKLHLLAGVLHLLHFVLHFVEVSFKLFFVFLIANIDLLQRF
jgi:hypothetical protein